MSDKVQEQPVNQEKVDVAWPVGAEQTTHLSLVDLARHARESVVRVCGADIDNKKMQDCGSGFVVENEGQNYLITNNHVLDTMAVSSPDKTERSLAGFEITGAAGQKISVDKYATDKADDLAAMRISGALPLGMKALKLGSTRALFGGSEVAVAAYSGGTKLTLSPGMLADEGKILLRDIQKQLSKVPTSADFNRIMLNAFARTTEGESGGPMFNSKEEVVGVETYTDGRKTSIAATSEEIKSFLGKADFKDFRSK